MTKQDSRVILKCIGNLEDLQKRIREEIIKIDEVCSGARMKAYSENCPDGIGRDIEQAEEGAIRLNAAIASIREGVLFLQESTGEKVSPYSPIYINEVQRRIGASDKSPASKPKAGISTSKSENVARPAHKQPAGVRA